MNVRQEYVHEGILPANAHQAPDADSPMKEIVQYEVSLPPKMKLMPQIN